MTVYLVGAGPGDPGLLTVRGAEVLHRADVVVHDRLAGSSLLGLAPASAERIDVGKRPGSSQQQGEINELLVRYGRSVDVVVRLKGGDPFVLGRGGEEALALQEAGVRYEVVPGITSAVAVPAYAGVPVTHRKIATSFTVVTGHRMVGEDDVNWRALAATNGTIVILMGVAHRAAIAEELMAGGRAAGTPVMACRWGTRPQQTSVRTTLAELAQVPMEPPATIVVGEVAGMDLGWYETLPLFGRRVVVTRSAEQASVLADRLRASGAEPVLAPTIAIEDPSDGGAALAAALEDLSHYDWVVLTSVNAVQRVMERLPDARAFGGAKVAAVGSGTAGALRSHRIVADVVAPEFVAESLLASFGDGPGRALLPRAAVARDVLPDGLRDRGWQVDIVEAYRTVPAPVDIDVREAVSMADAITFTSSSTVDNFVQVYGTGAVPSFVVAIGPVTAETARRHGIVVDAIAEPHTIEGVVDALSKSLGRRLDPGV